MFRSHVQHSASTTIQTIPRAFPIKQEDIKTCSKIVIKSHDRKTLPNKKKIKKIPKKPRKVKMGNTDCIKNWG